MKRHILRNLRVFVFFIYLIFSITTNACILKAIGPSSKDHICSEGLLTYYEACPDGPCLYLTVRSKAQPSLRGEPLEITFGNDSGFVNVQPKGFPPGARQRTYYIYPQTEDQVRGLEDGKVLDRSNSVWSFNTSTGLLESIDGCKIIRKPKNPGGDVTIESCEKRIVIDFGVSDGKKNGPLVFKTRNSTLTDHRGKTCFVSNKYLLTKKSVKRIGETGGVTTVQETVFNTEFWKSLKEKCPNLNLNETDKQTPQANSKSNVSIK